MVTKKQEAVELELIIRTGEGIALEASRDAIAEMQKLMPKISSEKARIKLVRDNALRVGIGTAFMGEVAPVINKIRDDMGEHLDDSVARALTGVLIAKIFLNIEKELKKHDK